jgi:competence protein ComGC
MVSAKGGWGRRADQVGRGVAGVVFALLLLAGCMKAVDLPRFVNSLSSWDLIPEGARLGIGLAIPSAEMLLCAFWFARVQRPVMEALGLAMLCLFIVGTWLQLRYGAAPTCRCFGVLEQYMTGKHGQEAGLFRAITMGALLALATILRRSFRPQARSPQAEYSGTARVSATRRGMTLIEAVLVTAIIALLLVLLLPSLDRVRRRASETKDLASLGSNAAILSLYSNDWKDAFPSFADPEATQSVIYYNGGKDFQVVTAYFASCSLWRYALLDAYYNGDLRTPTLYPAEMVTRQGFVGGEPFLLSCTLFAHPDYWDPARRLADRSQLGATFRHQVAFPSQKILAYSHWAWRRFNEQQLPALDDPRVRVPLAKADGSAAVVPGGAIDPGLASGDGADLKHSFHFFAYPPGAHTFEGLRGRDLP